MITLEGILLKSYGGFYYVRSSGETWVCRVRGKHRLSSTDFLPGDRVVFTITEDNMGVIEKRLERRNQLLRPPVCNVDQAVVVMALANPEPDLSLLDRILLLSEFNLVSPVICFNKLDLVSAGDADGLIRAYQSIGYQVLGTSTKWGKGIERLRSILDNKTTVFAGPSGVGKSSLLNAIQSGFCLKTGNVSRKVGRGKHTTRYVELLPLDSGGLVADSPGFSRLRLPHIAREELAFYFPEMDQYRGQCKFSTCLHYQEPDCAVREAAEKKLLSQWRYEHYLDFLQEVIQQERSY